MKNSILGTVKLAVIAALACAGCVDNSVDTRSPNNNGVVDQFLLGVMDGGGNGGGGVDTIGPNNPNNNGGGGDNYTYTGRTVTIGGQTWMAENLNRATANSKCYNNDASNCAKYGRLYTWNDALSACPAGWHLPSDGEWTALTDAVGGASTAGRKLKSVDGWEYYSDATKGTDDYGFSALPGGNGSSDGSFSNAGLNGYWWSATEVGASSARYRYMNYNIAYVDWSYSGKTLLCSVRCVMDDN